MKTNSLEKKLVLNKETIVMLSDLAADKVKGGATWSGASWCAPTNCDRTCDC